MSFSRTYRIIWADLDPNRHLRHSAYNDYAAQLRLDYFLEHNIDLKKLNQMGIGPILFREDTKFLREVQMGENIEVFFEVSRVKRDGYKWSLRHVIKKSTGEDACIIDVDGAWLDLEKRKIVVPPAEVSQMITQAPKTTDFTWLD